jgi:Uma2 family endonuclease
MATIQDITTARELLEASDLGRCELLRGELVMMSPSGAEHGAIAVRIAASLQSFVRERRMGTVIGADGGFQIAHDPDTVRAPDVGFVCADRVRGGLTRGFFPGAPDLAVEVVSPSDRASEVLAKTRDWLAAGCRAVWVVDPAERTVSIHDNCGQVRTLGVSDELTGSDVVPGFRLPVAEIFLP